MKNISTLIFACFTGIGLFAQKQKIISDCTITYLVGSAQESNIGSKTIYIKGKSIRIDLVSKTFKQTTFYNGINGDATVLKTIVRSNPGITLWVNGTVKGMWHHNDTPDASEVLTLATQ